MKIIYGVRNTVFYPYRGTDRVLPPRDLRGKYLAKVRDMGYDGLELGYETIEGENGARQKVVDLGKELADAGLPCVSIRTKGCMHYPRTAKRNREILAKTIKLADWIGADMLDVTVTSPSVKDMPGNSTGESVSQGSSRDATEADFQMTAKGIAEAAEVAADLGIGISIETHHHSIVDNTWSALHMLELIDHPNVGINPDVKNMIWAYDRPEDSWEEMFIALAPYANYWHCKNIRSIQFPGQRYTFFFRESLPDGELNYRWAMAVMLEAGFDGYMILEGIQDGDQFYKDGRSAAYARALIQELQGES